MYQVVPGSYVPAGTVNNVPSGCEMITPYNTINTPLYPQVGSWTTITNTPTSPLGDFEVNIEQVENGFIITTNTSVFIASDMVQLTTVLTKLFNEEPNE